MVAEAPTRVYWAGGAGFVRVDGRQARLAGPPHLQGVRVLALDWVPQQCAMVLPVKAGWRELEGHEIAQVQEIARAALALADAAVAGGAVVSSRAVNRPK